MVTAECKNSKSLIFYALISLALSVGLLFAGPAIADTDDDQFAGDCNQNYIPDVCELDPASNPELCQVQPGSDNLAADACGDAVEVAIGNYYSGQLAATRDGSASCGAASNSADVWFKFRNPPQSEDGSADPIEVKFSMSGTYQQYSFDVVLSLHSSCESAYSPFSCNDDNCGLDSVLSTTVADGQTIYLRLGRFAGNTPATISYRLNVLTPEMPTCIGAIGQGTDCNNNGTLDQCDTNPYYGGQEIDCNYNTKPDTCDIAEWNGQEVEGQIVDLDQNDDGLLDSCADCNANEIPDVCDVDSVDFETFRVWTLYGSQEIYPTSCREYCSVPGGDDDDDFEPTPIPETFGDSDDERVCGQFSDVNSNLKPDTCEPDCNGNNIPDAYDISQATSVDCNSNTYPDECDLVSPLVGTGHYDPSGYGLQIGGALEQNFTQRISDMFYLLFPNANNAGRVLVGPIGTSEGSAKDVAVDPSNGLIYAVGMPNYFFYGPTSQDDDDDDGLEQYLYQVNRNTGAGTAMPQPLSTTGEPYYGLTYSADGSSGYVCGPLTSTIDKTTGATTQTLPEAPYGIGMATAPNGDILSLMPATILVRGAVAEDDDDDEELPVGCYAGLINKIDPVSGLVIEESYVIDSEAVTEDDDDDFQSPERCRTLIDIAYGADGNFYGVTWPNYYEYDDDGQGQQGGKDQSVQEGYLQPGFGFDLVKLIPSELGIVPVEVPSQQGFILETVGPLHLVPLGLGGNLPAASSDCDANAQPDECQPDCDSDGIPDSCELDSNNDGIPDDCPQTTDCNGVPGGTAVLDRCGVCAGDGNSCLGCSSVDVTEELFSLDGTALELRREVRSATSKLLRISPRDRKLVNRLRAQSNALYDEAWKLAWVQLPRVVTSCTNTQFCVTVSNATSITTYNDLISQLNQLVRTAANKLARRGAKKSLVNRYRKNGAKLLAQGLATSASVPVNQSNCS